MKPITFISSLMRWCACALLCAANLASAAEADAPTETVELIEVQELVSQAVQITRDVAMQTGQAVEAGVASWYGRAFHGRRTASGERFDMNELTAAHKTLPLGTVVQVRNPINGKTVDAHINIEAAWKHTRGKGITIAVIDTGIDYNHPDLAANMWKNAGEVAGDGIDNDKNGYIDDIYGWNAAVDNGNPFDGHGHGTHRAGTIGAVHGNGGVAGDGAAGGNGQPGGDGGEGGAGGYSAWLFGAGGNDTLTGAAGADRLAGMGGNDVLTGNGGADLFYFDAPGLGIDQITDFQIGVDHIELRATQFGVVSLADLGFASGIAPAASDGRPTMLYDTATGSLYFDATGNDPGDRVQIAVLTGTPALTLNDFVIA